MKAENFEILNYIRLKMYLRLLTQGKQKIFEIVIQFTHTLGWFQSVFVQVLFLCFYFVFALLKYS